MCFSEKGEYNNFARNVEELCSCPITTYSTHLSPFFHFCGTDVCARVVCLNAFENEGKGCKSLPTSPTKNEVDSE